ncbi:MAG TPA: DUF6062 family protein, partial [Atribacteraceae bacterium]|nr:DUF6062 family protein [Atribacteraceae bacterium]
MNRKTDARWHDLQENISRSGCFLCRMERGFEERYLNTLFYENITDPSIRDSLRRQGGFCPDHVRLIYRLRPSVLGIAILYADLTKAYLEDSHRGRTACSLCITRQEKEQSLKEGVVHYWKDLQPLWGSRTFLCLRHLHAEDWPKNIRQDLESLT